eukprot:2457140-Rhodomonas_salina.1
MDGWMARGRVRKRRGGESRQRERACGDTAVHPGGGDKEPDEDEGADDKPVVRRLCKLLLHPAPDPSSVSAPTPAFRSVRVEG